MAGKDNLKPFKKGKDPRRNLKGRPVLPDISGALAKVLNGEEGAELELTNLLKVAGTRAAKGDMYALNLLLDRGFGKAKAAIDLNVSDKSFIFETDDGEQDKADT